MSQQSSVWLFSQVCNPVYHLLLTFQFFSSMLFPFTLRTVEFETWLHSLPCWAFCIAWVWWRWFLLDGGCQFAHCRRLFRFSCMIKFQVSIVVFDFIRETELICNIFIYFLLLASCLMIEQKHFVEEWWMAIERWSGKWPGLILEERSLDKSTSSK